MSPFKRFFLAALCLTFLLPFVRGASAADANAAKDANAAIDPHDYQPPIRVACLGDSITFGVGAGPGFAFPEQLDRMLGADWDVRNFGHSGATIGKSDKHAIWGTKQYKDALAFHPDVVIIMLGTNDTKPENWAEKGQLPKLYKQLVESFQKLSSKPRVFCCTPPYVAKKGNFGINEAGVLEEIPLVRQVASDTGAGVIDVHAALDKQDALFKDNVHPSSEGATLIAKAIYRAIAGKDWTGEVPDAKSVRKDKPLVRVVENPGEITYREAYAMIAAAGMPPDKLEPARAKYEATEPELSAKVAALEASIAQNDQLRMKYKHEDPKQAGEYKAKVGQAKKELEKLKRDALLDLVALVPADHRGPFGAAWVGRYVNDRLAPLGTSVTPEQRKRIREICNAAGPTYAAINNTPERSVADVETWQKVYAQVLTPEQKKRVEPK